MQHFYRLLLFGIIIYTFQNCAPLGEALKPSVSLRRSQFIVGLNYGWREVGADFGGIQSLEKTGVSLDPDSFRSDFQKLKELNITVVRWWVFSHIRGDSIEFDSSGTPVGLAGTFFEDVRMALRIAAEFDIQIMFCLFSFDSFEEFASQGVRQRSLKDVVVDPAKRRALIDNIIIPFLTTVKSSSNSSALHSWDVINEPEDAMTGPNKYPCTSPFCEKNDSSWGGDAFQPRSGISKQQALTHEEMEIFLVDVISAIRQIAYSDWITLGSISAKYAHAWKTLDLDFYQFHTYPHFNDHWPYTLTPKDLGLDNKPTLIGEYPIEGMDGENAATQQEMLESFFKSGYMGAMAWDFYSTRDSRGLDRTFQGYVFEEIQNFANKVISGNLGAPGERPSLTPQPEFNLPTPTTEPTTTWDDWENWENW